MAVDRSSGLANIFFLSKLGIEKTEAFDFGFIINKSKIYFFRGRK
jgi:hypothetical protein